MLEFKKGEHEFNATSKIETTVWLESCRLRQFAISILRAYVGDEAFKEDIDMFMASYKPQFMADALVSVKLTDVCKEFMANWITYHEFGIDKEEEQK